MSKTTSIEEQLGLLDGLADDLAERTAQIPLAARRIIGQSFPQLLGNRPGTAPPAYLQLGTTRLHWQLFLENREGKLVFFFTKKKQGFDNAFITDISFSIAPSANRPPVPSPDLIAHLWEPPPFLELNPPRRLVQKAIAVANDANLRNFLWINFGSDLLAIAFVASKGYQKSKMLLFKNRQPDQLEEHTAVDAPVAWFERLLVAIRPWANGQTAHPEPIALHRTEGEIQTILTILSENFLVISQKMQTAHPADDHPLFPFFPFYEMSDYSVSIRMRLTSEGKIIREDPSKADDEETSKRKEDLFQLEVQLKGDFEEGRPVVRFRMLPPDFLTSGPLFETFLKELHAPASMESQQKHLQDLAEKLETTPAALEAALTNGTPAGYVFRVQRKRKWDTQMFVLPVQEAGTTRHLFFSAEFEVEPAGPTAIFRNIASVTNLLKKKGNSYEMQRPSEEYFMRLLFFVNDWKNRVV